MLKETEYCKKVNKDHFNQPMNLTSMEDEFEAAAEYYICQKYFTEEEDVRVRDHCHITERYKGAARNKCNKNFKLTDKIRVIFHNLKRYDSHLIIQEIGKFKANINVIPNNLEKYMAFFLREHLKFIDSLQFMNNSLKSLAKNITISDVKFTSQEFQDVDVELMKEKMFIYMIIWIALISLVIKTSLSRSTYLVPE